MAFVGLRASLCITFLVAAGASAWSSASETCVYTVYVRTGNIIKAGTDSNISLALGDSVGEQVMVENVVEWGGVMGEDHDYFERGNLDIFSGRGPCMKGSICSVEVSSDGTGSHHGWYCEYVEVTSTGPHIQCQQHLFRIDQWLATDAPPYQLTAVRDECASLPQRGVSSL